VARSVGDLRINEWGEKKEAFRLLDLVPAPSKVPAHARGFGAGPPSFSARPGS
jgi:hypothetical protein